MKNFFAKIKIRNVAIVVFAIALTLFSSCSNSQSEIAIITIDTGIQLASRGITDVKSYRLTVSAADMKTVSETFTESKISLTLYKGNGRLFTLEALNKSGETVYRGSQTKDLYGKSELEIFIVMNAVDTDTDSDEPVIPITILVDGFATFLTKPTLSWEQAENSSFKVRYAESKEALLTAEEIKCEINSYTFREELSPGTYYWQCCSVVNDKTSDWSQAVSFTINDIDDGSSSYNIGYAYDLCFISENIDTLKSKNFKLIANIDMNNLQEKQQFAPISDFQAIFDGNYKTISNLKIDSDSDYIGLFKYTTGATVKDLTLKDIDISGTSDVGGLIGQASDTNITNCHVSGKISAVPARVGGLVGCAKGKNNSYATIKNCSSSVTIQVKETSGSQVGGIVGSAQYLIIENCHNDGSIVAQNSVGGIVGTIDNSNITNCYNTATIEGNDYLGGIAGNAKNTTKIEYCNNSGEIRGATATGGLVGQNTENASLSNSYNMGDVYGTKYSGGLVGNNVDGSSISNCYVAAGVYGKSETYPSFGALIGYHTTGTVKDCYFDSEKCNLLQVGNREENNYSKTTIEMKEKKTYSDWDFVDIWGIDSNKNNGYPYLLNM